VSATKEKLEITGNFNEKPNSKETAIVPSKVRLLRRRGLIGKYIGRDTMKRSDSKHRKLGLPLSSEGIEPD
jgi:hypothetical protein